MNVFQLHATQQTGAAKAMRTGLRMTGWRPVNAAFAGKRSGYFMMLVEMQECLSKLRDWMVGQGGLEPPTCRLRVGCSAN